jgi:4-amino-4-deoxy-L-arabinose transferase-like glycosyltransferase
MSGPQPAPGEPRAEREGAPGARGAEPRGRGGRFEAALLALVAAALLFANLGGPRLWSDEGDTAVFARTIAERGLPWAWDGRTFTDSDKGRRLTPDLLMVGTPWLPFYVTAASFAALGESAFAARAPFAACGVLAVLLLHRLVLCATGDRRAALAGALLLLASVQFLLYARQCRHYALNMALGLAAVLAFLRLRERPRDPWLVVALVLLYHTHPLPTGAILAALGGLTLVHPAYRDLRRAFWLRVPIVLALTLPWLGVAWTGWEENSSLLLRASDLPPRVLQMAIETSESAPVLGWLALVLAARRRLAASDRAWLALAGALFAGYFALTPLLLDARELWQVGLRYACGLLPLAAGIGGLLVARAARGRVAFAGCLALFGVTHLPGNAVWWPVAPALPQPGPARVAVHLPAPGWPRIVRSEWLGFARELAETDPGTVSAVADLLARHAGPDDRLVTNYAWDPLYFHTRLPQALKVLPSYPIHDAARAKGLPDHVFSSEGARWLVWRWPWEGYQDYWLAEVRADLERRGATLERVAVLPDTQWENRPELHFHRFPGGRFVYPAGTALLRRNLRMEAIVFRIAWPTPAPPAR